MDNNNVVFGEKFERTIESNLGELALVLLKNYSENVLQIDALSEEKLTGLILLKKAIRIAKFLKQNGIGLNDTVSVMSENRLDFCIIPVAAFFIGATFAPLNPDYTPNELKHTLNLSKPKIIFTSSHNISKITKIRKHLSFLKSLVLFDSDDINNSFVGFNKLLKGFESDEIDESFQVPSYDSKETVATVLCSSGTTGMPKGVMCTHENMTTFMDIARKWGYIENDDDFKFTIGIIPFFHSFGFMTMFMNILAGRTMIVFNKFRPKLFLDTLIKYKVSILFVPPPIVLFLAKNPLAAQYDLSFIKEIISGAASLSEQTEKDIKKKFNIKFVLQGYGMTETTLSALKNPTQCIRQGSVGKVVPGMMAKVIDENGKALGPNKEGELCVKGPLIMKGYMNDEKATRDCIDPDGWLHTGDVAYYDNDEYFYIVDRLKELIKYKAYQVPPAELESILIGHPDVLDAAVIGLPDEYAGELPLAYIVKKQGARITEGELQKYVAEKVSPQKQLRGGVRFVEEIPRNQTGKILRRVLKERVLKSMNISKL